MLQTFVCIDLHNGNVSGRIDNVDFLFSSAQVFLDTTGYPYGDTSRLISYEPERDIFFVERLGREISTGSDLPEIQWVQNNLSVIAQEAATDAANNTFVPTLRDQRNGLLYATDWVLTRWQEETTINVPHSMTEEKFAEVLVYRQALRDITKLYTSVDDVVWPTNPLE
jgi:hypothetical protein